MRNLFCLLFLLCSLTICAQGGFTPFSNMNHTAEQQPFADLSQKVWNLMADKNADELKDLIHPSCMFVHMGGYWGTEQELQIIRGGMIHYKHAKVYGVDVKKINDDNWAVYSTIVLEAVVGNNSTSNPFFTTQIFTRENGKWLLSSFVFSTRMMGHGIEVPSREQ